MTNLGKNLKIIMAYRDMGVKDLAALSNLTTFTIYSLIKGEHFPQGGTLNKMATALRVTPVDLLRTDLVKLGDINGRPEEI
jgi:DNA-binding Xre family transcriptional regulator